MGKVSAGGRKPAGSARFFSQFTVLISRTGNYAEVDSCLVNSWGPLAFWFSYYTGNWLGDDTSRITDFLVEDYG